MRFTFQVLLLLTIGSCQAPAGEYVCTPCNLPCDKLNFSEPGICPHCNMALIRKSDLEAVREPVLNLVELREGSGEFLIDGGRSQGDKTIKVFYHRPKIYGPGSRFLIVIPGAGRNADSYRDAWIDKSERYGLVIMSPMYQERDFGFEDYHLCGLIDESNLMGNIEYVENSNLVKFNEEAFSFRFNTNSDEWIFNDFDRIFKLAAKALNSTQTTYDMFGHSAGGHILHRFALFQKNSMADRILASNASFYTMPSFVYSFPFGLRGTPIDQVSLKQMFKRRLVVLLGEQDDENETGGTFLRSKSADEQGFHRLARGQFFFEQAKEIANEFGYDFNWEIAIVPDVGHDHRLMGDAAGRYLYENSNLQE